MTVQVVFNDTDNAEGDEFEVEGNFDLQITTTGQGVIQLLRRLGNGSEVPQFNPCREYTGPTNDIVANVGLNTFKIVLSKVKDTTSDKIVVINQA